MKHPVALLKIERRFSWLACLSMRCGESYSLPANLVSRLLALLDAYQAPEMHTAKRTSCHLVGALPPSPELAGTSCPFEERSVGSPTRNRCKIRS